MADAPELMPCPFCGGSRVLVLRAEKGSEHRIYPMVRCMGCYLDLPGKNGDYSADGKSAVAAWNTRADLGPQWRPIQSAPKAAVDALSNFGPTILLASNSGHRAVGYWRLDKHGWANLHDHLVMEYWNEFTHWMRLPTPPQGDA